MAEHADIAGFCRDCLADVSAGAGDTQRCRACGSPRLALHPEIDELAIAHIDCDAFYAAIEKRDNPELRDKPVIVGGGARGVVSTACYIARIDGVHSAQPMFQARKACPEAVIIKPDMAKYAAAGREIRKLMRELTPMVEPLSIDEAFLDLSGTTRLHGRAPARSLAALANRIEGEIGITVSCGLSYNKFLAKIASDLDKPRGLSVIGRAEATAFLARQPVDIIWGVGKAFNRKLAHDGFATLAQLARLDKSDLMKRYGVMGARLYHLARGEDARRVNPRGSPKSISSENTFSADTSARDVLERRLWRACERTAKRAKQQAYAGTTVVLKLKTAKFRILTRSRKLEQPTNFAAELFDATRPLLVAELGRGPFRLLGVGLSGLIAADTASGDQLDLIASETSRIRQAERALDAVRGKYGDAAIVKGRAISPAKPPGGR